MEGEGEHGEASVAMIGEVQRERWEKEKKQDGLGRIKRRISYPYESLLALTTMDEVLCTAF